MVLSFSLQLFTFLALWPRSIRSLWVLFRGCRRKDMVRSIHFFCQWPPLLILSLLLLLSFGSILDFYSHWKTYTSEQIMSDSMSKPYLLKRNHSHTKYAVVSFKTSALDSFKIPDRFGLVAGVATTKVNIHYLFRGISPRALLIMSACCSAGLCQL